MGSFGMEGVACVSGLITGVVSGVEMLPMQ